MKQDHDRFLHAQVQEKLHKKFEAMPYMSPIPSERELCLEYGVSRPTIRKALSDMEQAGLVSRIQGRGSFYTGNKVSIDYSNPQKTGLGLFHALTSTGKVTRSHVLQQVIEVADAKLASRLQLPIGELVFHLQRLRFVDDELYSLANDYIPLAICPDLIDIDFSSSVSLLKTLDEHGIHPCREDKLIEFIRSDPKTATYLRLKKNAPISVTRITTYDREGRIIQYATSKSDAYKSQFRVTSVIHE